MNSFTVVCGGVEEKITPNTDRLGWNKLIELKVREVLRNGHIHNRIVVGNKVLFSERDLTSIRKDIFDSYTTYREYTEEERFLNLDRNADGSVRKMCAVTDREQLRKAYDELEENITKEITKELVDILDGYLCRTKDVLTTTKRVSASGGALKISITPECNALGIGVGDYVEITIRRVG